MGLVDRLRATAQARVKNDTPVSKSVEDLRKFWHSEAGHYSRQFERHAQKRKDELPQRQLAAAARASARLLARQQKQVLTVLSRIATRVRRKSKKPSADIVCGCYTDSTTLKKVRFSEIRVNSRKKNST